MLIGRPTLRGASTPHGLAPFLLRQAGFPELTTQTVPSSARSCRRRRIRSSASPTNAVKRGWPALEAGAGIEAFGGRVGGLNIDHGPAAECRGQQPTVLTLTIVKYANARWETVGEPPRGPPTTAGKPDVLACRQMGSMKALGNGLLTAVVIGIAGCDLAPSPVQNLRTHKALTPKQREQKRAVASERWARMTPEQRERKYESRRKWWAGLTPEQREQHREYKRKYVATPEQLQRHRDYMREWRTKLSPEQRERRREYQREWLAKRKARESIQAQA